MNAVGGDFAVAARRVDSTPWALPADKVEEWLKGAAPGERIVYAGGNRLVRTPGVEAMTQAADEGEVILNWRPGPNRIGEWLATRRATPVKVPATERLKSPKLLDDEDSEHGRVLKLLKRVALGERPCPSNREIAQMARLNSPDQAAYQLRKLIMAKAIRVDTDTHGYRVVTILGTGRKTKSRFS